MGTEFILMWFLTAPALTPNFKVSLDSQKHSNEEFNVQIRIVFEFPPIIIIFYISFTNIRGKNSS